MAIRRGRLLALISVLLMLGSALGVAARLSPVAIVTVWRRNFLVTHLSSGLLRLVPAGPEELHVSTVFPAAQDQATGREAVRAGNRRLIVAEEPVKS